jgi:hypothetical protein
MAYKDLILKPTRNVPPHKIVSEFRTDFTGQAGHLVKVSSYDPDSDTYYSSSPVGGSYDGIYSNQQVAPYSVAKTAAGDTSAQVLGITLEGTATVDANGNKVDGFNKRWADENGYVASGKPVQIATEGLFWIDANQLNGGIPAPGSGLKAGAAGTFALVDTSAIVVTGAVSAAALQIGKVISSTGTRQSDVLIQLSL